MSSFTEPLLVEITQGQRKGRGLATLLKPFAYHVGGYPSADVIVVPAGYTTDFASVPRLARWLFTPFDRGAKAAVIHDWLVDEGRRSGADVAHIFREALAVLEVQPWRRWIMWAAVRAWLAFRPVLGWL